MQLGVKRLGMLNDPDGKRSFGRCMILLSAVCMLVAAYIKHTEFLRSSELLFTTFMGWEARKRHGTNATIGDRSGNGVPGAGEAPEDVSKAG